jgi:methionine-gamma-lyase
VWLNLRFTLSYRDVEDLLAERGLELSYETVRRWVRKFGPYFAKKLRSMRPRPTSQWHLDSTFASPALQRPLEHGAHIVLHSLTKYINGHGDLLGGVLLSDRETISPLHGHGLRYLTGATLSPMAALLILRGLKTLPLRMERHSKTALSIARKLADHRSAAWVRFPFLDGAASLAGARRQMSNGSGMLSFGLHSGFDGARRVLDRLRLATRGVSLGDVETLVNHPRHYFACTAGRSPRS